MQCEICQRPPSSRRPFNCTLCAREILYQSRIQLAQTLLNAENLGKEVERNVNGSAKSKKAPSSASSRATDVSPVWRIQSAAAEEVDAKDKTQDVLSHVQILREEIKAAKDETTQRKARMQRRRTEFTSAKKQLAQSQTKPVEEVEKGVRRTEHRWDILHTKTAEARLFLCREAALLCNLQQRKHKKGGLCRDIYLIGGVPITDLRDLNNASPAQISTSNTNLAHLVHLVSHYLSLRLPAEITLPHRDYPLPTIFSPSSSYTGWDVSFPGFTPSHSSNNSPSASRHADHRSLPRPRPLNLDKKLSVLAKDDQVAYASFVEGITFLAWDIAWLCKTQGLNTGGNSWEDVCAMGKNLYQLLLTPPQRPPFPLYPSNKTNPQQAVPLRTPTIKVDPSSAEKPPDAPLLGYFSHGTAYAYLASAAGTEYMRDWRLQSPIKVIDKVKAMLLAERTGAEWELLEGNEWEDEGAQADAEANVAERPEIEQTGVLVRPEKEGAGALEGIGDREKGRATGGWMKVKSR